MPRLFTPGQLSRMRGVQEQAMQDTGRVWAHAESAGDYGASKVVYTPGAVTVCGLDMTGGRNVRKDDYTAPIVDARLRLPIGTVIRPHDKFEVITRYGEFLTPALFYEVDGPARIGPSGIVVDLRRVEAIAE
jgi:hypothetical protein